MEGHRKFLGGGKLWNYIGISWGVEGMQNKNLPWRECGCFLELHIMIKSNDIGCTWQKQTFFITSKWWQIGYKPWSYMYSGTPFIWPPGWHENPAMQMWWLDLRLYDYKERFLSKCMCPMLTVHIFCLITITYSGFIKWILSCLATFLSNFHHWGQKKNETVSFMLFQHATRKWQMWNIFYSSSLVLLHSSM